MKQTEKETMANYTYCVYAPNLISICIDRKNGTDYEGRIWNEYDPEPRSFSGMLQAFEQIEEFLDDLNFPQKSTIPRTFGKTSAQGMAQAFYRKRDKIMGNLEDKNGAEGTFIVQIKYRQNSTWQGQVVWAEENKKVYFRSALELLRLIDGAISEGAGGFVNDENAAAGIANENEIREADAAGDTE